jgi:hypothetical protein
VKSILRQAAQTRLLKKAEQIQARARQAGWHAALREGLLAALGYKRNVWPMRRLAELIPSLREGVPGGAEGTLLLQARCFGVAGLLPAEVRAAKNADSYVRRIWDIWWREAESFREFVMPQTMWNLGGIRPANHPQRRIALASHWMQRRDLEAKLEDWLTRQIESPDLLGSLEKILQVGHDDFWSYHWTWSSKPFPQPQSLLGEQRITDLAMNVILPWLYLRACAGANEPLMKAAEARYFLWPAGEDNSTLRLARQRLFGGVSAKFLRGAAEQQGVLQIVLDFCDHSNAVCHHCQFPELVSSSVGSE